MASNATTDLVETKYLRMFDTKLGEGLSERHFGIRKDALVETKYLRMFDTKLGGELLERHFGFAKINAMLPTRYQHFVRGSQNMIEHDDRSPPLVTMREVADHLRPSPPRLMRRRCRNLRVDLWTD